MGKIHETENERGAGKKRGTGKSCGAGKNRGVSDILPRFRFYTINIASP